MPVESALRFVQAVRRDDELKRRLEALGPTPDDADLVRAGAEAGYDFTPEELHEAFARDWSLRSLALRVSVRPSGEASDE